MDAETAPMAACEPILTNESITSTNSTRSNGNLRAAYRKFMSPVDSLVSSPGAGLLRRTSSVDRPKNYPETPTKSLPISSNRFRQKPWSSVASKGVDAIRSSAKSTNYSKRTPYNRTNQISGPGSYRLISVTQPDHQSTPCPDKRANNHRAGPAVDKALPSEKPLPSPPESAGEADKTPTLASRTIIDATEATLRRSPPGDPQVNEEWPALSPVKGTDEAKSETVENMQDSETNETQLTRIDEETCVPVADGVRMFTDALNKLNKATRSYDENETGQRLGEENSIGSGRNTAKLPYPKPGRPTPPKIITNFADKSIYNGPAYPHHVGPEGATGPQNNAAKSNPFRNRPRVASSPSSARSLPFKRQDRSTSYSFDHSTLPDKPHMNTRPIEVSTSNPFYAVSAITTPRMDRSGSKIPRMSPRILVPISGADLGSGNGDKISPFSPSKRSSIPLPRRLLQQNKNEEADRLMAMTNPSVIFDRIEPVETEKRAENAEPSEQNYDTTTPVVAMGCVSETSPQTESKSLKENEDPFYDDVTVKQLSKSAPLHGPQLRITPEAERLIMGEDDINLSGQTSKEIRGPSRQSGNKREFRLSTDSLFATFSSKRSKNPSYRLSFSGKSTTDENFLTSVGDSTAKSVSKSKSADFGIRRVPSGHRSTRRRSSPEKEAPCLLSEKAEIDPFLDSEKTLEPNLPAKDRCGYISKAGGQNEPSAGSPAPESAKKSLIPVAVGESATSPIKGHGSVERLRKPQMEALKANSPKSSRHAHRNSTSYGSPRRYNRRMSADRTHHRPKPIIDTPNGGDQQIDPGADNQLRKEKRHKKHHRRSADPLPVVPEPAKSKGSAAKGVFSNFRGLFTKHKAEVSKESTRHLLSYSKPMASSRLKISVPASHSVPHLGMNGNGTLNGEHSPRYPEPPRSPALRDTGRISTITMEILDSARTEVDTSRKEKLIRLGKILIEAVNNSHDAEKAMLTAVQAAKEAEVACAMAKENALRMSQVACDWTRPLV